MAVYYQYIDEDSGKHFYFNSETQETVWEKPFGYQILDPETNEILEDLTSVTEPEAPAEEPTPEAESVDDPAQESHHASSKKKSSKKKNSKKSKTSEPPCDPFPQAALYDAEVVEESKKKTIVSIVDGEFREIKVGGVFSKKVLAPEDVMSFSTEPLKSPLLIDTPKSNEKDAVQAFKLILQYQGLLTGKVNVDSIPGELMKLAQKPGSNLDNEIWCMLVKQITNCKDENALKKALDLLIVFGSRIPPSYLNIRELIPASLAQLVVKGVSPSLTEELKIAYLRVFSMCSASIPTLYMNDEEAINSLSSLNSMTYSFGASLWEILFWQKDKHPGILIPYVVHQMAEKMFELGAHEKQGIFRLPGNMVKIEQMARLADRGQPFMEGADLNDVASLFKYFFRIIPGGLIPKDKVEVLIKTKRDDQIAFAESLPIPAKPLLAYLIGFLQKLVPFSEVTMMGVDNLAMVFAPNVIFIKEDEDAKVVSRISTPTQLFLEKLIMDWDVSSYYPLK